MTLAARINQRPETINGYPCSVGSLIASLEGDELAALQKIMYGRPGLTEPRSDCKGWTEREVHKVVTDEGYSVAKNQINEHRGKRCRCYKGAP